MNTVILNPSGIGHQLTSKSRAMKSASGHLEEAYHDLMSAGNTTEVLDLRTSIHRMINRLDELACAAEDSVNQND
jgi:hypothetical protein